MALVELPVKVWTEVLGSAPSTYSEIVNVGLPTVLVAYAASSPAATSREGVPLPQNSGDRKEVGLSKIYARPLNDAAPGLVDLVSG